MDDKGSMDKVWVLHEDVFNVDTGEMKSRRYVCDTQELAKRELALRVARYGKNPIPGTFFYRKCRTEARWFYMCYAWRLYIRMECVNHDISPE